MKRRISGFHQDSEGHWVAELECGHAQHVLHEPPLMVRQWVLTEAGRRGHIGTELNCVLCDEEDARIQGLCDAGAREVLRKRPSDG